VLSKLDDEFFVDLLNSIETCGVLASGEIRIAVLGPTTVPHERVDKRHARSSQHGGVVPELLGGIVFKNQRACDVAPAAVQCLRERCRCRAVRLDAGGQLTDVGESPPSDGKNIRGESDVPVDFEVFALCCPSENGPFLMLVFRRISEEGSSR